MFYEKIFTKHKELVMEKERVAIQCITKSLWTISNKIKSLTSLKL